MSDFDIYGIFVPSFLIQAILAYVIFVMIRPLTSRFIEQGWVIFLGLFNLCLYLICLFIVHQIFIGLIK
ncbi:DUF1656 domain-containing protein [Acinetobacter apis]|uniref:DUF1656 domain-containing protein n=1 Tax=Acinetobacter apis TaxID=1229165 RepID=A0A217EH56_9GAMM|nr:DUF1656 domain-containing protein [Acinetobacter apis]SNQ29510.1 Protein of unknown function [Acinetobacter apis]